MWEFANYVYIDFRDTGPHFTPDSASGSMTDMRLDYFSKDTITYQFDARHNADNSNYKYKFWHINLVSKELKVWDKYGTCIPPWIPDKGTMYPDTLFVKWPLNANLYNGNIGHENPGDLGMNILIDHDVTVRDTIPQSTNILIPSKGYLKIGSGRTFNMTTAVGGSINLIIQDSSSLLMEYSSHLIVGNHNMLTLKSRGSISFISPSDVPFAEIIIDSGATFCNEGGTINGVIITYKKSVNPHLFCAPVQDVFYNDSTKIVLAESAVMEIPDGVTMHFSGIKSGLIMKPNSKLMLGVGCKIIFDSSASLIANGATFTSIDSTLKWDGIILSNTDADTITN